MRAADDLQEQPSSSSQQRNKVRAARSVGSRDLRLGPLSRSWVLTKKSSRVWAVYATKSGAELGRPGQSA